MGDMYCAKCGEPVEAYYVFHEMEEKERECFLRGEGCECCNYGKPKRKCRYCKNYKSDLAGDYCQVDYERIKSWDECDKLERFAPHENIKHLFKNDDEMKNYNDEKKRYEEWLLSVTDPSNNDDPDGILDRISRGE